MPAVGWTIFLAAAMTVANWGLSHDAPDCFTRLPSILEYDRQAICRGQVWRLATGNWVHWSREHFYLDVGAFLALGLFYEPALNRRWPCWGRSPDLAPIRFYEAALKRPFPWLFAALCLAVGLAMFALQPDLATYRGLSGVDSGIFAAALLWEASQAGGDRRRWLWVLPASLIFVVKLGFECTTGELFFGSSSLGDLGQPVPLAHAAGAFAAVAIAGCVAVLASSRSKSARGSAPPAKAAAARADLSCLSRRCAD